jgi:hypothetical protein
MIVSHRHRFIFIKTRKVGGTSLEIALSRFLGPDDIVTPISPNDEELRRRLGYVGPQNYRTPLTAYSAKDWARLVRRGLRGRFRKALPNRYVNHVPARTVRKHLGDAVWSSYTKFSIERNPYDLAVSMYHFIEPDGARDFPTFVRDGGAYVASNFDLYTIGGMPALDRILRYEQLGTELPELAGQLGLGAELPATFEQIPAKSGLRGGRPYRDYYDAETRRLIEIQFAREIALFGYSF